MKKSIAKYTNVLIAARKLDEILKILEINIHVDWQENNPAQEFKDIHRRLKEAAERLDED
tara:strand:+ start:872 stop:1051 length:180 start_codon:yes stop_codon:yes gene_type:complete